MATDIEKMLRLVTERVGTRLPESIQAESVMQDEEGHVYLRLAIAVQEKLESRSPTLMRPITLLNYRYNQFAAPGSLLVEVGAAGNSLDEALRAARLFAKGFAETILGR